MAIISKTNFKTQLGDADLELEAKTGQGLIVRDIKIYLPNTSYITVRIAKNTVGYFRVDGVLGSHLPFPIGRSEHSHDFNMGPTPGGMLGISAYLENAGGTEISEIAIGKAVENTDYPRMVQLAKTGHINQQTLLSYLGQKGLFKGFPIASGEKFVITGARKAGCIQMVEYEIWEEADITPEMENGSKSPSYLYVNYGHSNAAINVATDVLLGTSANPAEFPDFPFGGVVPSGRSIELHSVLASDVKPLLSSASSYTATQFLKFMQGKVFLFDEDRQGLLYHAPIGDSPGDIDIVAEGRSVGGNFSSVDLRYPFMFDPPILFPEGQELTVYWQCIVGGAGAQISTALQEVAFVLRMIPAA